MLKFWYLTLFAFIFSMIANYLALLGPMYLGNAMNAISNKTGVLIDEVIYNFWQMLFCYITSFVNNYNGYIKSKNYIFNAKTTF